MPTQQLVPAEARRSAATEGISTRIGETVFFGWLAKHLIG
jgi:hypothetical protein